MCISLPQNHNYHKVYSVEFCSACRCDISRSVPGSCQVRLTKSRVPYRARMHARLADARHDRHARIFRKPNAHDAANWCACYAHCTAKRERIISFFFFFYVLRSHQKHNTGRFLSFSLYMICNNVVHMQYVLFRIVG